MYIYLESTDIRRRQFISVVPLCNAFQETYAIANANTNHNATAMLSCTKILLCMRFLLFKRKASQLGKFQWTASAKATNVVC